MRPLLSLAAVAVLVLLAWFAFDGPKAKSPTAAPAAGIEISETSAESEDGTSGSPDRPTTGRVQRGDGVPADGGTDADSVPLAAAPAPTALPTKQTVAGARWEARHQGADWTADDYLAIAGRKAAIPPEELLAAYEFLRSCEGRPRDPAEYERLAARAEARFERRGASGRARLEEVLDMLDQGFERCGGLGTLDLTAESFDLLELSADMGYLPAQVEFLESLWGTLLSDSRWLFANPGYADRFRDRALTYGQVVLTSRTPEGVLAYAEFMAAGIIAPPDYEAAWAYADLSRRLLRGAPAGETEQRMRDYERSLSPEELDAAVELAGRLCELWCDPP
ncbi:MAG: hypothetical protein AAGA41_00605 [Pseudomonadota bacterium]